jgi:general stress protein 26
MAHDVTERNALWEVDRDLVVRAMARRTFCFLSTVSPSGHPHGAGVLYAAVDTTLYVNTFRATRKARNIAAEPRVGVVVPVRRLPIGPPSAVQFQGSADLLDPDDPAIERLMDDGTLKSLTSHGELDHPDCCFVRITPVGQVHTYGLGMPLRRLIRDPLGGLGVVADPLRH